MGQAVRAVALSKLESLRRPVKQDVPAKTFQVGLSLPIPGEEPNRVRLTRLGYIAASAMDKLVAWNVIHFTTGDRGSGFVRGDVVRWRLGAKRINKANMGG